MIVWAEQDSATTCTFPVPKDGHPGQLVEELRAALGGSMVPIRVQWNEAVVRLKLACALSAGERQAVAAAIEGHDGVERHAADAAARVEAANKAAASAAELSAIRKKLAAGEALTGEEIENALRLLLNA